MKNSNFKITYHQEGDYLIPDLVIKKEKLADEKYARILEIVKSSQFKKEIDGLGGYDTKDTGKIMAIT